MSSYESAVEILPSSIFEKGLQSVNRKLWKLFSEPLDDLENGIRYWFDKDNLEGDILDKLGLLKGIPRQGLNDVDYRYELDLPRTLEIVTLPAVYQTLSELGTNPRVKELHSSYLFDIERLDGQKILDGTWDLFPAVVPSIRYRLDGTWLLNGIEPLEPYGIRKLALLIRIDTNESFLFQRIPFEIKKLLAGITVYYQIYLTLGLNIDLSDLLLSLDGTWLLDGSLNLSSDMEAVFYNGNTELYRREILLSSSGDSLEFSSIKRTFSITRIDILRANEVLVSKEIQLETSFYLEYFFYLSPAL
ncbi:MAG: hypothetical protein IPL26_19575 [Leptospiraceae bacterium]|nr:hypothetical protein [Leptospiraceae bacterium]